MFQNKKAKWNIIFSYHLMTSNDICYVFVSGSLTYLYIYIYNVPN